MTLAVVQAKPVTACTSPTAFSIVADGFMDATGVAVQAVQAKSYCPRVSLFSEWKRGNRDYNRKTPVPPVPPPSPIPSDWVAIPLEACLFDPLYRGTLTGKVPDGWSRDGWVMSLRDRMTRTDDKAVRKRLQDELDAVQAVEASAEGE
jgi:hypothetical protein